MRNTESWPRPGESSMASHMMSHRAHLNINLHKNEISTIIEYVQGVPKKTVILSKIPITGLKRGLKIKVG